MLRRLSRDERGAAAAEKRFAAERAVVRRAALSAVVCMASGQGSGWIRASVEDRSDAEQESGRENEIALI